MSSQDPFFFVVWSPLVMDSFVFCGLSIFSYLLKTPHIVPLELANTLVEGCLRGLLGIWEETTSLINPGGPVSCFQAKYKSHHQRAASVDIMHILGSRSSLVLSPSMRLVAPRFYPSPGPGFRTIKVQSNSFLVWLCPQPVRPGLSLLCTS